MGLLVLGAVFPGASGRLVVGGRGGGGRRLVVTPELVRLFVVEVDDVSVGGGVGVGRGIVHVVEVGELVSDASGLLTGIGLLLLHFLRFGLLLLHVLTLGGLRLLGHFAAFEFVAVHRRSLAHFLGVALGVIEVDLTLGMVFGGNVAEGVSGESEVDAGILGDGGRSGFRRPLSLAVVRECATVRLRVKFGYFVEVGFIASGRQVAQTQRLP